MLEGPPPRCVVAGTAGSLQWVDWVILLDCWPSRVLGKSLSGPVVGSK